MEGDIYKAEEHSMPQTTTKTIVKPQTMFTVSAKIPRLAFEQLSFWRLLTSAEQNKLEHETSYLFAAGKQFPQAGRQLYRIQSMLAPYANGFAEFLKKLVVPHLRFSGRTGYRYIERYENLVSMVKEPVIEIMLSQGFDLDKSTMERPLGVYTEAFEALRSNSELPPDNGAQAAVRYVRKLELQHEKLKSDPRALALLKHRTERAGNPILEARRNSEDFLTRQATNLLNDVQKRLPPERRDAVLENIVGYQLTRRGIASKTFRAMAIPQEERLSPIPA
jgi:hypothetical protein